MALNHSTDLRCFTLKNHCDQKLHPNFVPVLAFNSVEIPQFKIFTLV